MAEGIVGGQEIPGVAALLDQRAAGAGSQSVGIIGPAEAGRRAGFAGEVGGGRPGVQQDAVLVAGDALHRERHRGIGDRGNDVDLALVDPAAGDRGRDVGLVLVVGGDHLDRLAEHLAAEILDRHLRGDDGARSVVIGIDAGQVGEHADAHDVIGNLRLRRNGPEHQCGQQADRSMFHRYLQVRRFLSE